MGCRTNRLPPRPSGALGRHHQPCGGSGRNAISEYPGILPSPGESLPVFIIARGVLAIVFSGICLASETVGESVLRIALDRLRQVGNRRIVVLRRKLCEAAAPSCPGVIRSERHHPAVIRSGALIISCGLS